jgi:hypothetical protein
MDLTGAIWRKSRYSGSNDGACIEVASVWRKSTHSGSNGGACVEVGASGRAVAIRDSKDPAGPALAFAPRSWQAFADHLKSTT